MEKSCHKNTCTEAMVGGGGPRCCFHVLFKFDALGPVLYNCPCVAKLVLNVYTLYSVGTVTRA